MVNRTVTMPFPSCPMQKNLFSLEECFSSSKITRCLSRNALCAVSNETLCFLMFSRFLFMSHSNTIHITICDIYHTVKKIFAFLLKIVHDYFSVGLSRFTFGGLPLPGTLRMASTTDGSYREPTKQGRGFLGFASPALVLP